MSFPRGQVKQDEEKKKKLLSTLQPEELDAELKVSTEAYFWASLQRSPSPISHENPFKLEHWKLLHDCYNITSNDRSV